MKKKITLWIELFTMVCFSLLMAGTTVCAGSWTYPVPGGRNGCPIHCGCSTHKGAHDGMDIIAPQGTNILAAESGTVICSNNSQTGKYDMCPTCKMNGGGFHVEIQHGNSLKSVYCHMSRVDVYNGQWVNKGQVIGAVGQTGFAFGAHLHFMVAYGTGQHAYWDNNVFHNPADYISQHTHSYSWHTTKNPTCTLTGIRTYSCACGHSYNETIAALGHSYSSKKIPQTENSDGYTLHTCSRCRHSYKDQYVYAPKLNADGWYYCDVLPSSITGTNYVIQYSGTDTKIQTTHPGNGYKEVGIDHIEWRNSGAQYETNTDLPVSDARILVYSGYYHWCGPNAGAEGNYESTGKFNHYDEIAANRVNAKYLGNDAGHPYYYIYWPGNSNKVGCQSGVSCDGKWGSHGARCFAWYKRNIYQDRVSVTFKKYIKDTGWMSEKDSNVGTVKYRFKKKTTDKPAGGNGNLPLPDGGAGIKPESGGQTRPDNGSGTPNQKPVQIMKANLDRIVLKTGQTTWKVKILNLPAGDRIVSWKSTDKKIVKVNQNGQIKAQKKTGTAQIIVTSQNGQKVIINVKVQKKAVKTKRISGLPEKITLPAGTKKALRPIVTPITSEQKITYHSSNKRVATISQKGVIKAKKQGKAKITVRSGSKKVVLTVKVKK